MTFDTDIELQKTFHEAMMQHAQKTLRTGPDWAEADEIFRRRKAEQDDLKTAFDAEQEQRIDAERDRLMTAPDKLTFDHPAPKGLVQNKDADLTRQARAAEVPDRWAGCHGSATAATLALIICKIIAHR